MNGTCKKLVHALISQTTSASGLQAGNFTNDSKQKKLAGTLRVLGDMEEKWFVRIEGFRERTGGGMPKLRLRVYGLVYNPTSGKAEGLGVCASHEPADARYKGELREDNLAETVTRLTQTVIPEIKRVALETKAYWARVAQAQVVRRALAFRYGIDLDARRAAVKLSEPIQGELSLNTYGEDATHCLGLNLSSLAPEQVDAILAYLKSPIGTVVV
jgi:hypothetical protein